MDIISPTLINNHLHPLPEDARQTLVEGSRLSTFQKGEVLFHEGEEMAGVRLIVSGKAKLCATDSEGKEMVLDIIHDGDLVGESAILDEHARFSFTAVALKPGSLRFIPRQIVVSVLERHPDMLVNVANVLQEKLKIFKDKSRMLSESDATSRLAAFLLDRDKRCIDHTIALSIDDIAASVNLRRETVSRKLSDLARDGAIVRQGQSKLKVVDHEYLAKIAGIR